MEERATFDKIKSIQVKRIRHEVSELIVYEIVVVLKSNFTSPKMKLAKFKLDNFLTGDVIATNRDFKTQFFYQFGSLQFLRLFPERGIFTHLSYEIPIKFIEDAIEKSEKNKDNSIKDVAVTINITDKNRDKYSLKTH